MIRRNDYKRVVESSAGLILTPKSRELILWQEMVLFITKELILFKRIMTHYSQYLGVDSALVERGEERQFRQFGGSRVTHYKCPAIPSTHSHPKTLRRGRRRRRPLPPHASVVDYRDCILGRQKHVHNTKGKGESWEGG